MGGVSGDHPFANASPSAFIAVKHAENDTGLKSSPLQAVHDLGKGRAVVVGQLLGGGGVSGIHAWSRLQANQHHVRLAALRYGNHERRLDIGSYKAEDDIDIPGGKEIAGAAAAFHVVDQPGGDNLGPQFAEAILEFVAVTGQAFAETGKLGPIPVKSDVEDADPRAASTLSRESRNRRALLQNRLLFSHSLIFSASFTVTQDLNRS
jgi:hypothetical protein